MKMKMTKNSIKEIETVNSTIQCIKDTCPFPLDDSWRISDGIKNGKKFEIDGPLYPHELNDFEDFETDKITLGLSISTCSRMNRKGDYVRYPKEYEMGKACVLEEVLLENLRELKPQLKYFTIDIDDYGLEDDGDNGWEHWMGFVLTPIQSVFEKEKEEETRKRHELHVRIYDTVEKIPLTEENIKKLLKFDNEISGFDRVAKISNNKIYDYGKMKNPDYIDDTIPCSMTFKEYLNHFYASSSWGIEGYGYDEKDADEISEMFDDLKLDLGDKMDETKEMDKIVEMINDEYDLYGTALEKLTEEQLRNIIWNEVFPEIYDKILKTFREWAIDHVLEMLEEDQEYTMKQIHEWLSSNLSGIMLVISRDQNGITEETIKNLEEILNKRSHKELMCLARMI